MPSELPISCKNCSYQFSNQNDLYCPMCGQKRSSRLTLASSLEDYMSTYLAIDSKLVNTIIPFIFKPGLVPKEYIEGKRRKYIGPWQTYFFFSFILLLALTSLFVKQWDAKMHDAFKNGLENLPVHFSIGDTLKISSQPLDSLKNEENNLSQEELEQVDSLENLMDNIKEWIQEGKTNQEIFEEINTDDSSGWFFQSTVFLGLNMMRNQGRGFLVTLFSQFAIGFAVALLIFTLLLYLLYIRQDFTFVEHFVHAMYYFSFLFLLCTYTILALYAFPKAWLILPPMLLGGFYLYKSMRKVYGQSRPKTFLKFALFSVASFLFIPYVLMMVVFLLSLIKYQ